MGESINPNQVADNNDALFLKRLRKETSILKQKLESLELAHKPTPTIGLEVEAWLMDENFIPSPRNTEYLKHCNDKNIVEEISKFNFEINTSPTLLTGNVFSKIHSELTTIWNSCRTKASDMDLTALTIGIHPLVRDQMLQPEFMSDGARYQILNDRILELRQNKPLLIDIHGFDRLQMKLNHILIEAAATSIQIHIQSNQEDFKRIYNASMIASIPCVAAAANSPYLYGHDLWDETRIPLFEQSISLKQFRNKKGAGVGRVTFGTGYVRRSPLELFLENLDGYPPLAPVLFDDPPEKMHHLRFHNGTLWRWNRPIVGFEDDGTPHFRIEQRAMASGPSLIDMIANAAFSIGLTFYYATHEKIPEESMTFTDCTNNFYEAAKNGLRAEVQWFGKTKKLNELILNDLIPRAEEGLEKMGVDKAEIQTYIRDVIRPRVMKGQNGANWQRSFVETHGKDFQALTEQYFTQQISEEPVHEWS